MVATITAADEYAKDNRLQPADVAQLRAWLTKQPHLPQALTDEYLITALHSSEYSVEQAKQLVEGNITCRTNFTEMFSHRDPATKDKQLVWDVIDLWVTPEVTKENYRIFFGGLLNFNPELFDFANALNVAQSVLDTTLHEQGVCPGYVVILNCRGFTLSHLASANISHIRNILHYAQEAICIKIKAIHVIYVSPIIDKIMFIVKPLLKKSLLDILYFHTGDMDDFYEAVPRDILPVEIGGTMGHREDRTKVVRNRVERLRQWLMEEEKLRVDDSKRPNHKKDVYSVAGSFRKLDLD